MHIAITIDMLFAGRELIIEMFLYQTQYLNAIQTMCPHVLRYLATAVVINKTSRRQALRVGLASQLL